MLAKLDKARYGPWALVTGASSGIGREFARQIAASGINVVLVARREAMLRDAGAELSNDYGVAHRIVVADLSEEGFLSKLTAATDGLDIPGRVGRIAERLAKTGHSDVQAALIVDEGALSPNTSDQLLARADLARRFQKAEEQL